MGARVRFNRPPVVEVVCGVTFETTPRIPITFLGLYREQVRKWFPELSERPPLNPVFEPPDIYLNRPIELQLSDIPPWPRVWFHTTDEHRLIQLQQDRFLYNWKRPDDALVYPSYDDVIGNFEEYFGAFRKYLVAVSAASLAMRQYELVYVNHIPIGDARHPHEHPDTVLVDHRRDVSRERFLPSPASLSWQTTYDLPANSGRLHVTAQTARKTTGKRNEILRLELLARGFSGGLDGDGMRSWFDQAHVWITNGFADSTDERAQKDPWERTQ